MSVLFAATHPERVSSLVLYGAYAQRTAHPRLPLGRRPAEERAAFADASGDGLGLGGRHAVPLPVGRRGDDRLVVGPGAGGGDPLDGAGADGA